MNEVIAADGKEVPVPAEDRDRQVRPHQGQAGGEGDGPAVGGVVGVQVQITGHPARTADSGNHGRLIHLQAGHLQPVDVGMQDHPQSATRAPDVGDAARL